MNTTPITGQDLKGKTLLLKEDYFSPELKPKRHEPANLFHAVDGFGCSPTAMGRAVFGSFGDGEKCRVNRGDVEAIVTE